MKRMLPLIFLLMFLLACCGTQGEVPSALPSGSPEVTPSLPAPPVAAPEGTTAPEKTEAPVDPTPSPEVTPSPAPVEEQEIVLYLPNDSVDGFVEVTESVKKEPQAVVDALVAHSALPEGTKVLKFEMEDGGKHIVLDLSREFETALCSMGTSGEAMLTGSLVFTLLDCWGADTLTFTCEGRIVESGHVVYDFPLSAKK